VKSIKHIGVFLPNYEPADPALERARSLAIETSARISLLTAMEWQADYDATQMVLESNMEIIELPGADAESVRAAVDSEDIDILLKTARPQPASGRVVGGLARDLLRGCPCPVWVVRRSRPSDRAPVIAAISSLANEDVALARRVIQTAARIAQVESRRLLVAHVWSPLERALGQLVPSDRRLYIAEHRRWRRRELKSLTRAFSPIEAECVLLQGAPESALTQLAAEKSSETIVVGHQGRSGISAFLFGNAGERIIEETRANVISVRAA